MPEYHDPFNDLIRRVRSGDGEAASELVRRYEPAIRRVVRVHLRDQRLRRVLDSTDVCQSVLATFFVRATLGQYDLDSPQDLLRLLATIARHKVVKQANRLTSQKRDVRRDTAGEDAMPQVPDAASDPSEQAAARELLEKVRDRLGPEERYLAEQRSIGRSWQELADELGGTDVALRKKLTRALDRVMAGLGLGDDGDV